MSESLSFFECAATRAALPRLHAAPLARDNAVRGVPYLTLGVPLARAAFCLARCAANALVVSPSASRLPRSRFVACFRTRLIS